MLLQYCSAGEPGAQRIGRLGTYSNPLAAAGLVGGAMWSVIVLVAGKKDKSYAGESLSEFVFDEFALPLQGLNPIGGE